MNPCTTPTIERPSSDFAWYSTEAESFSFLGSRFDVRAAKRLIKNTPRPVLKVRVVQAAALLGGIAIFEENLRAADTDFPIILATLTGKPGEDDVHLPIDGWHRIRLAVDSGLEFIPAVLLTADETRRIRRVGGRS